MSTIGSAQGNVERECAHTSLLIQRTLFSAQIGLLTSGMGLAMQYNIAILHVCIVAV